MQELYNPFAHDRKNEENPGESPFYLFPVFSFYGGYLTTWYNPRMTKEAQVSRGQYTLCWQRNFYKKFAASQIILQKRRDQGGAFRSSFYCTN